MANVSVTGVRTAFARTRDATRFALHRRDAAVVFGAVSAGYLTVYLWMVDHLAPGLGDTGMTVVADPVGKFLEPELGPVMFTPIARITIVPVTYLFTFNTVIGAVLAGLVGVNLALTYWSGCSRTPAGLRAPRAGCSPAFRRYFRARRAVVQCY